MSAQLIDLYKMACRVSQADTSYDPSTWTPTAPLDGHCEVLARIVQALLGGNLARGKGPRGVPHTWNKLPGGVHVDLCLGPPPRFVVDPGKHRLLSTRRTVSKRLDTFAYRMGFVFGPNGSIKPLDM